MKLKGVLRFEARYLTQINVYLRVKKASDYYSE